MTTIHRCDRCSAEFEHESHLTTVSVADGKATIDAVDLCEDCDAEELVGRLLDLLDSYTADGGATER